MLAILSLSWGLFKIKIKKIETISHNNSSSFECSKVNSDIELVIIERVWMLKLKGKNSKLPLKEFDVVVEM
jgi:hypothetical protein